MKKIEDIYEIKECDNIDNIDSKENDIHSKELSEYVMSNMQKL